jgi:class 3 adenylate cyclase
MTFKDDLESEVKQIFKERWTFEKTSNIPDPDKIRLSNHAKDLETATVLYADLDGSTNMVDNHKWDFSAEIYKTYLRCAARIIAAEDGVVTAYDGDRIMAVFTGYTNDSNAVRASMKINYAVNKIIRPALSEQYPESNFTLKHVVGVDTSQLRAARIGVRGYNDLVWIGRAANYAAKLTSQSDKPLWITKAVYDKIDNTLKISDNRKIWERRYWQAMNDMEIYCSAWDYSI